MEYLKINDQVVILSKTVAGSMKSLEQCKWKKRDIAYVYSIDNENLFLKRKIQDTKSEFGRFHIRDVRKINEQERLNILYGGTSKWISLLKFMGKKL